MSAASFTSQAFRDAIHNPLQTGINSNILQKAFADAPEDIRNALIQDNKWAILGRRISAYLSQLPPHEGMNGTAYDCFGNFVNFAGHMLTKSLLKHLKISEAQGYIERVEFIQRSTLSVATESTCVLKSSNFSSFLNHVDVPEHFFGKDIILGLPGQSDLLSDIFTNHFYTEIIRRDETTSGTSLRALASKEAKQNLIGMVKKMVAECGLVDSFESLRIIEEASCMILEGKEIYHWIEEEAKNSRINPELVKEIQNETLEGLTKKVKEHTFKALCERLQIFIEKNPNIPLKPEEVALYIIQDFYPRAAGAKFKVKPDTINQARNTICLGIKPIQFPRVTIMEILLDSLPPLEVTHSALNLMEVLKKAKVETSDESLDFVMDILQFDICKNRVKNNLEKIFPKNLRLD